MNFIAVYNKLRFFAEYNNFHEIKYLTILSSWHIGPTLIVNFVQLKFSDRKEALHIVSDDAVQRILVSPHRPSRCTAQLSNNTAAAAP